MKKRPRRSTKKPGASSGASDHTTSETPTPLTDPSSSLAGATDSLLEAQPPAAPPAQPSEAEADTASELAHVDPAPFEPHSTPPIVGIGASAGGLDAFLRLLHHIPADTGLAFVLVQHLDPTHESQLADLLRRAAIIPVLQAADGMRVEADHAYVIPPNTTMTVTDGHLSVVARKSGHVAPIDALLTSLAEVSGGNVVGVILSGAGADGTRGIEAIKEAGGITMVQDGATAAYPSMPHNAVGTGSVDFVLTPEEIAEQLVRLGRHLASLPGEAAGSGDIGSSSEEEELRKILLLLQRHGGVDFQQYRRGTVHRRILRRMLVHRQETRKAYLAYLRTNPAELEALREDLLIGVTSFFRDPEVFATLKREGFPHIMEGHQTDAPLRVWVAGCSCGQEAYSLAIALVEFLGDRGADIPIQIFGTDLSETSIATARAGLYAETISADVSPERLQRYFVRDAGGYRIAKKIRDLCVFSRQDVVRDPPFSHLDLISCRNVLIYLEPVLQRRVFPTFHYALEPHGLLVLGSAESAGEDSEFFVPLEKRLRIYRRRDAPARVRDSSGPFPNAGSEDRHKLRFALPPEMPTDQLRAEADRLVLARHAPAGVVIDDRFEILQFRGDTSAFLAHAAGVASLHLLKLVRPELALPLQSALTRARAEGRPMREAPLVVLDGGRTRHITIEVIPFQPASRRAQYFVILFEEGREAPSDRPPTQGGVRAGGELTAEDAADQRRERWVSRDEADARERYLQALVEQHEAASEELRAANEAIQSSNEELQSTNEELETTKEEVQSTNEELTTVNEELRQRHREQVALASDLENILANTTIPIVIVGKDFRLRRFTPASHRVMRAIPSDIGRSLHDIRFRVALQDLEQRIATTVEMLTATEDEVRD